MTFIRSVRYAALSVCLAVVLACADLQPLKDHISELDANQQHTAALVDKLIKRIAAALVQVEEARKELARLAQSEGR